MGRDVIPRELFEVGCVGEPHLLCFLQRRLRRHPVSEHTTDHPERTDPDGRGAMDEHRPIRDIVGDAEKLVHLRVGGAV